jgi:disulfide bond formation protein DsbB
VGEGVETLGNPLRANDLVKNATDGALADLLRKGRSTSDPANRTGMTMPPRGGDPKVGDTDLRDVVAFLRTIQ